ncbi:periodic tryptophan protein 1, partial [Lecanoromycetidae sp. Uapishka_2]
MSMITASLWVPRGAAAAFPTKYEVDEDELARISKLAKLQLEDANEDLDAAKNGHQDKHESEESDVEDSDVKLPRSQGDADDDLREYDLEHYDSDTNARDGETMAMFGNAQTLAYHESNADDPYITMQENDEEDEEREELQILATDNMIVAAKVEDEVAHLEVYVYEDEADNLYVHHDIMLPAIPLCVEWLDLPVGKDANTMDADLRGNYVAVDKVCSIAWHPRESTVLLSGSYDRTVVTADMRAPEAKVPRWGVESDVETVTWDPHDPNYFYVTTENGIIHFNDIRNAPASPEASKAVWTLQAHDESISSFDINAVIPGFLATGSTDKTVKLWNVQSTGPSMVVSRNVEVGKVFSTRFAPDPEVAFRLAVAGSKGAMQIWDTSTNAAVRRIFASRMSPTKGGDDKERIVGVEEDSSDSEEEGGVEPGGADASTGNGWKSMDDDSP